MVGDACRDAITAYLDVGYRLEQVETELIDGVVGLSEDERAALWLYAWAYHGLLSRPGGCYMARSFGDQ